MIAGGSWGSPLHGQKLCFVRRAYLKLSPTCGRNRVLFVQPTGLTRESPVLGTLPHLCQESHFVHRTALRWSAQQNVIPDTSFGRDSPPPVAEIPFCSSPLWRNSILFVGPATRSDEQNGISATDGGTNKMEFLPQMGGTNKMEFLPQVFWATPARLPRGTSGERDRFGSRYPRARRRL